MDKAHESLNIHKKGEKLLGKEYKAIIKCVLQLSGSEDTLIVLNNT